MPAGPGQVVGGIFNGVLEQSGNPAFRIAGRDWRDLPSNMEPARESGSVASPS